MKELSSRRSRRQIAAAAFILLSLLGFSLPAPAAGQETEAVADPRAEFRARILTVAERYATFEWTASERNVFHGADPGGVHVDTPDTSFDPSGWRADGRTNRGMPYSWGGFSSIEEFEQGLQQGMYAGNIPASTRAPGSARAVGLDCSGFVARAWDLPTKQSTRTLGALCYELAGYEALRPGDILNLADGHVVLFKEWVDEARTRMCVYEAARLRVKRSEYTIAERKRRGFVPMRYKPLDERWVMIDREGVSFTRTGEEEGRWIPAPEGVYPELDEVTNPLADAVVGEWADYTVTDSFPGMPGSLRRTVGVARVAGNQIDTQTTAEILGKKLMTGRSIGRASPVAGSLVEFMAFEEPLADPELIAGSAEVGEYVLDGRYFSALRISAFLETSWMMRGVNRPVTIEIDCVLSEEVAYQGVLEASFLCEIVWAEDEEGNQTVSQREQTFALKGFGGV
jgi:hypothetical protein